MRSIYQNTSCLCLLCCSLLVCLLQYAWLPLESASQLTHGSLKQLPYLFIILSKNHPTQTIGGVVMREYKGKCSECMKSILRHNAICNYYNAHNIFCLAVLTF